jgi:hypothetical protein
MFSWRECTFYLLKSDYDSSDTLVSNLATAFLGTAGRENSLLLESFLSYLLSSIFIYLAGVAFRW